MENQELTLATADGRTGYEPGETLAINATWDLPEIPKTAEVRLVWYTQGKGDADLQVVQQILLDNPQAADTRTCEFILPESPYSFSGKLISLIWAVELLLGKKHTRRLDLVVAPGMQEVQLTEVSK